MIMENHLPTGVDSYAARKAQLILDEPPWRTSLISEGHVVYIQLPPLAGDVRDAQQAEEQRKAQEAREQPEVIEDSSESDQRDPLTNLVLGNDRRKDHMDSTTGVRKVMLKGATPPSRSRSPIMYRKNRRG